MFSRPGDSRDRRTSERQVTMLTTHIDHQSPPGGRDPTGASSSRRKGAAGCFRSLPRSCVLGVLLVVLSACSSQETGIRAVFGEGAVLDIGAFLPVDSPTTDLTEIQELLTEPHVSGRGVALLDGIWSLHGDYGRMVLYVQMLPTATEQRRDEIVQLLRADPRVDRVEIDVVVVSHRDE